MKTPKLLTQLRAVLSPRPKRKLQATARAARPAIDDYDTDEPQTKLSSAFIVVLILHVVAVGGIYAFNSIKASRRGHEADTKLVESLPPLPNSKAAPNDAVAASLTAGAPAAAPTRKVEPAPVAAASVAPVRPPIGRYEVKGGDSMAKIAFAYGVPAAEIMAANQIKEGTVLRPGQILVIPAKGTVKPVVEAAKPTVAATAAKPTATATAATKTVDVPATKTTPGIYTVKKGDTLISIARTLGISIDELSKANRITDPKKLQLGQVLKVPPRKS